MMDLADYLKTRAEIMRKDIDYLRTERAKTRLGVTRWAWEVERAEAELHRIFRDFDRHCTISISEAPQNRQESKDMAS